MSYASNSAMKQDLYRLIELKRSDYDSRKAFLADLSDILTDYLMEDAENESED